MNKLIVIGVACSIALGVGFVIGRTIDGAGDGAGAAMQSGQPEVRYWVAPMDPNFRRDQPGKSPMGMDLVPVYASEFDAEPGVVAIDPVVVNSLGVRTAMAERGSLARRIETVGNVGYDEDTLTHVHTRVEGWVETLAVKASGDPVKAGQLLFELYSPTIVNAQQEYLAALRSNNRAMSDASLERLAALGVGAREIARLDKQRRAGRGVRVYAAVDGIVTHLGVREGMYVTPATEVLAVGRLDSVWVYAEVFERQSAWVEPGQPAMIELDYLPGRQWHGTVDYIYPELNAESRTLSVRLRLANDDGLLRPNMFARVVISAAGTGDVVHVPRAALIRGGTADRVVLALGEGRFRAQPVEVGIESGDRVVIRSGVEAGDLVVVSGQFLIDSESNIESALSRMRGNDEPAPMDHSGHDMDMPPRTRGDDEPAPMDHSGHDMDMSPRMRGNDEPAPMDHSGHDMDMPQ